MPISFQRVLVRLLRRVMRASIFAPFATTFLANSRLVMRAGALGTRVVVADAGLAHVDDHVQHGVPKQIGIRIGARVQQL